MFQKGRKSMPKEKKKMKSESKKITRYSYNEVKEPRTPETGHTALLPNDELEVTLPMDNGWSNAIEVGKLPEGDERPVVVDMDPSADPVLFWAGKRNKRVVPVLPLQRNEIVTDSRIAQIIERARKAVAEKEPQARQGSLFADLEKTLRETDRSKRVEFYTHEEGWKNKLICGDSMQVMGSLLYYENLRGKVQMIYFDPPYGIKYDSNFQQRVDSADNDDEHGAEDILTIKAFRDTWLLGVHSYLSYLTERLYLCRDLLADTGSIFLQISEVNLHLVRCLMDEVFGRENHVATIAFRRTGTSTRELMEVVTDYLLWYCRDIERIKYRSLFIPRDRRLDGIGRVMLESPDGSQIRPMSDLEANGGVPSGWRVFVTQPLTSQHPSETRNFDYEFQGYKFVPSEGRQWATSKEGIDRLVALGRVVVDGKTLRYKYYPFEDFPLIPLTSVWLDTPLGGFRREKLFAVQTPTKVIERCLLMTTDPGDVAFDLTGGSGTTGYCAEKLGRRWITCDTSRVAINVARQRLLEAIFEHYITRNGTLSSGFVYKTVNRVTVKSLAFDLEPEKIDLVDQPEVDKDAIRVCGPFEVMTLGRYSLQDWKGYLVGESASHYGEPAKLENYIEVICRLYRKDASIQGAAGLVHAVAETEKEKIAISVGPLSGRVTCKQISDAVQDAVASGILEVHVLGWAFEANVGEVKSHLEKSGKVKVELIMIRPDTLAEGLKATKPEMLFSPFALPDIEVTVEEIDKENRACVTLNGVALFDRNRRTTEYKTADSGYVSAWYLDEDYDGDCFVDCQMFFDFKKAPNLRAALKAEVDPAEYTLQLKSQIFPLRSYKRIAVKVVDVYGNESTVVKEVS